jgi:5-(carboxyamino)imidazole ribonucleotide synthase
MKPAMKLGILGGGQLGMMMCEAAKKLKIDTYVIDQDSECSARNVADHFFHQSEPGLLGSQSSLNTVGSKIEVLTLDIEKVDLENIADVEKEIGIRCLPSVQTLEIIQDKYLQKKFFGEKGIRVTPFYEISTGHELLKKQGRCMAKRKIGGYDGQGNRIITTADELKTLDSNWYLEEMISLKAELAVLIGRYQDGTIVTYPVVEMDFDPRRNINTRVLCPARISVEVTDLVASTAIRAIKEINGVGIFGVEFFMSTSGEVFLNEIACRPHNSGHYTIEGCNVSQFETHLRAVCGLPPIEVKMKSPTVMVNLLGEPDASGEPLLQGEEQIDSDPEIGFHWYRKSTVKPFRKMGHYTVCKSTLEKALEKASQLQKQVKVVSKK